MFKLKNKLLALISTHILVCALSMSEDNSHVLLDYNQQEHSSSVNDNQYTNKVTSNALNIQSYTLLMVLLLVVLSLSLVGLALYKSFYPSSTSHKKIVWIILLILCTPLIIFIVRLIIIAVIFFLAFFDCVVVSDAL